MELIHFIINYDHIISVYIKSIKMMNDDILNLGIENKALRSRLGEVDEKWLDESKKLGNKMAKY